MNPQLARWKQLMASYFVFAKWQRRVALILLSCFVLLIFVPAIYLHYSNSPVQKADAFSIKALAELKVKEETKPYEAGSNRAADYSDRTPTTKRSLFYFDPNTASEAQWQQLGLRDKTIQTIRNYLNKGGQFRKPEDLKRIYGLRPDEAEALIPYVRISNTDAGKQDGDFSSRPSTGYSNDRQGNNSRQAIELNSADSSALIALPGIGPKLAARIINYRDKLHGFYSVDQLGETYGVPDSTFQKIKPRLTVNPALLQKININTATAEELKTPYIKFNVANAIVQYRLRSGPFATVEDLKKIPLIDEYLYEKIAPYLTTE